MGNTHSYYKPKGAAQPPKNMPGSNVLRTYFDQVDINKDGSINAKELHAALDNGNQTNFNMTTVNMMIDHMDQDDNGDICFKEFGLLWHSLLDWQNTFQLYDHDKNDTITLVELEKALASFGYNLRPAVYAQLLRKLNLASEQSARFDDFIKCCLILQGITAKFTREDAIEKTEKNAYEKYLIKHINKF